MFRELQLRIQDDLLLNVSIKFHNEMSPVTFLKCHEPFYAPRPTPSEFCISLPKIILKFTSGIFNLAILKISRAGFKYVEALGRIIIRGPYLPSNAIIDMHLQL